MNRSLGSRNGRERVRRWLLRWWRAEATGRGGARGDGVLRLALAPAEALYRVGVGARNRAFDGGVLRTDRLPVPVVSVGNLSVGGAGKTPVAAWLAAELQRRGFAPAILHGGYAADEPMLHRSWNPDVGVVAERDRVNGGRRAIANGATAVVLDDGFQHRRLARDIDLVLVAAETWPRRLRLLPRGPWRETPAALARATLIAVTRRTASPAEAAEVARLITASAPELPAPIVLALRPEGWVRADGGAEGAPAGGVLAVAGIAWPELFFETARGMGVDVEKVLTYPDHHDYGPADAAAIERVANGRPIVMTEKDWVKLAGPPHPDPLPRAGERGSSAGAHSGSARDRHSGENFVGERGSLAGAASGPVRDRDSGKNVAGERGSPSAALMDPSRVWVLRERVEVETGAATLAAALDALGPSAAVEGAAAAEDVGVATVSRSRVRHGYSEARAAQRGAVVSRESSELASRR